ncbi:MAG: phosphoglucosamine mutase, partial [Clostridia bacterium]|nr:phosphoglucosamine mutase [Clostridia bacterium]
TAEGKLRYYTDEKIKDAVEKVKTELGTTGRIVVRPSGTEPLIRVMVEGDDAKQIEKLAKEVAAVIKKELA